MDVLQWQDGEEVLHLAQGIPVQRNAVNGLVTDLGQREFDTTTRLPEANCRRGPTVLLEHMPQVGSALTSFEGLPLKLLELCHATSHSEIGCTLAPVAARVR